MTGCYLAAQFGGNLRDMAGTWIKPQGGVMGWFDRLKSSKIVDKGKAGHASEGEQNAMGLLEKGSFLEQQGLLDDALSLYCLLYTSRCV